jgi:hypothetical protein
MSPGADVVDVVVTAAVEEDPDSADLAEVQRDTRGASDLAEVLDRKSVV